MSINIPGTEGTDLVVPSYGDIEDPKATKNARHVIRECLCSKTVFDQVAPLFVNGGVCGHKVMDLAACVDLIVAHDKEHGGNRLKQFKLNKKQLGDVVKNVLRERYELDRAWKIIGLSKRVQLAAPKT